jgi:hypothetical protein
MVQHIRCAARDLPLTFLIREAVPIGELSTGQYRVVAEMFDSSGEALRVTFRIKGF